jgi:hypothetical protein
MFAAFQNAGGWLGLASKLVKQPLVLVIAGLALWYAANYVNRLREKRLQRRRQREARNWPVVTATIDVAAVVQHYVSESKQRYTAALNYFYRNPELQVGEYRRSFATKEQAKQWGALFKGRTVPVHINPRAPADSVLMDEDVDGSDLAMHVPAPTPEQRLDEMPQVIAPAYRLICGLAELAGLMGLATSGVLLAVSVATHGKLRLTGYYWVCGVLLALCVAAGLAVQMHLRSNEQGRWLLRSYKRWCPGWMRWCLNLTGGSATLAPVWHLLNLVDSTRFFHQPWVQALMPYLPYAIGCWIFFLLTAFHAALLRSQEELHVSVVQV